MSSPARAGSVALFGLDPATYEPHAVHRGDRSYIETNCYTDVIIELLHARGDEPLAVLGATARLDFEGDQWTFFKPHPEDLERLFGVDIHEMQPYRPLADQIADQLAEGRTLIVELDSFYLPDTAATSYRRNHVKSSAVMEAIDREDERLVYFHNSSLHELAGDDYREVFRLGRQFSDDVLPPYTEIVRFDAGTRLQGSELRSAATTLLRRHLAERPATNPFVRFGEALNRDLPALLEGGSEHYHDYAFATVRMAGAGFELLGSHVRWLVGDDAAPGTGAIDTIVSGCKILSFKLARRRPFDPAPTVDELATAWDEAQAALDGIAA